jgi:predicted negative regulator of RcsB-dependent stress response
VDEFRTEEEQIAAIKNWWKKNGTSVLLAIVAALAIVFGYRAWQNNVEANQAAASGLYQQLVAAATSDSGIGDSQTVAFLANELKTNFADSEYANFASLFLAKSHIQNGALDLALEELNSVLENTEDSRTQHIVTARKSRILSAQGKHDEALALLSATDMSFQASYLELSGDIKLRKGDSEAAKVDYLAAYELVKDEPQSQPLLGIKLSNLGVDTRDL